MTGSDAANGRGRNVHYSVIGAAGRPQRQISAMRA